MFDMPGTADAAFARYEAVRHRLPMARFPDASEHLPGLLAVADHCDGFLLDAFGVLNVVETAIPGAVASTTALRAQGKRGKLQHIADWLDPEGSSAFFNENHHLRNGRSSSA